MKMINLCYFVVLFGINGCLDVSTTPVSDKNIAYSWQASSYGTCSGACGTDNAIQTRTVTCVDSSGTTAVDSQCTATKPISSNSCTASQCSSTSFDTKEKLGEALFFDKNLSLTRNTSCSTCHNPDHAFVDARYLVAGTDQAVFINGALSVGDDGTTLGGRNAPTAAYAKFSPIFDPIWVKGGQFHDGRAATLKDQAMGPPLDMAEMMMPNKEDVVARIEENTVYVDAFKNLYGDDIFNDKNDSFHAMGDAIGAFEKTDLFSPFDSKYDRYLNGNYTMNPAEQRGMDLYFDNRDITCANCHITKGTSPKKTEETFSDYNYWNIGAPKNLAALDAKGLDYSTIDHGIYGRADRPTNEKPDSAERFDGAVRTATLRNIAVTAPYMHNGVFKKLRTVLEFYNHMSEPSGNTTPNNPETGQPWIAPDVAVGSSAETELGMNEMNATTLRDVEAFLRTLTDKRYEHLMPPLED